VLQFYLEENELEYFFCSTPVEVEIEDEGRVLKETQFAFYSLLHCTNFYQFCCSLFHLFAQCKHFSRRFSDTFCIHKELEIYSI